MKAEKVLEFAHEMENVLKEKIACDFGEFYEEDKYNYVYSYPKYGLVLDMIKDCKNEIALNEAKNKGSKAAIEKKRTSAAKAVLKESVKRRWADNAMAGYKTLADGKIALTNGYVLYVGTPIIGINESPMPGFFPDFNRIIPNYKGNKNVFNLDITNIKTKLKYAKAEWKGKLKKGEKLCLVTEDARLIVTNQDGEQVNFNSELIIQAYDMLGGENYTIQVDSMKDPAIIKCKENENFCVVMPVRIQPEN